MVSSPLEQTATDWSRSTPVLKSALGLSTIQAAWHSRPHKQQDTDSVTREVYIEVGQYYSCLKGYES